MKMREWKRGRGKANERNVISTFIKTVKMLTKARNPVLSDQIETKRNETKQLKWIKLKSSMTSVSLLVLVFVLFTLLSVWLLVWFGLVCFASPFVVHLARPVKFSEIDEVVCSHHKDGQTLYWGTHFVMRSNYQPSDWQTYAFPLSSPPQGKQMRMNIHWIFPLFALTFSVRT